MTLQNRPVSAAVSALLLFALTLLAACGQGQQAAQPQAQEPEVAVATIAPRAVTLTTVLPGRTSAHLTSEVRPQVGGIIQKRLFREGSDVKAGEALYQIDPATYQAAFDTARAALAKAEANALPARLKAERYEGLVKVRGVSQQDNDDAQAARRQSEAEVLAAKAALDTARINLSYTRVAAPISGRIGKSSVTPGALVTASQATPLATIQQADPVYVDVTQSSAEVMRLKRELASGGLKKSGASGARVKLIFDDGTTYAHEGTLQFSDITVDQGTGVVTLRAEFPNPQGELLPGLYVRAVIEEGVREGAILVPQGAVMRDSKGNPMVMTVKADGTVEPRPIQTDRAVGDQWLVGQGLAAGDRVIVDGLMKARPGAKVKAVEAGAAPAAAQAPQANATAAAQAEPAKAPAPAKAEAPKPEAPKAEAPKAEKKAEAPAPAKPEAPKVDAPKAEKPAKAPRAEARPSKGEAYSPPRDQWPNSADPAPAPAVQPSAQSDVQSGSQPSAQ